MSARRRGYRKFVRFCPLPAQNNAKIHVCPGLYKVPVMIDGKRLTVEGDNGAVLQPLSAAHTTSFV